MKLNLDDSKPIFQQIADYISDSIIQGAFLEGEQIPSTNQFAAQFQINPATAAKGINQLVDQEILFKKRGIGMFVAEGAREKLIHYHRRLFYDEYVKPLLKEAEKLKLTNEEVIDLIKKGGLPNED